MNFVLMIMTVLTFLAVPKIDGVPPSQIAYAEARIDRDGLERAARYQPIIEELAHEYGVPEWVILGVLYNESNMTLKIVGDHGVGMGMGQVRCSMTGRDRRGRTVFSWLPYLKTRNIDINLCAELFLDPYTSIRSSVAILAHQRGVVMGQLNTPDKEAPISEVWKQTIRAYNLGNAWNKSTRMSYYYRVVSFGKILEHNLAKKICI